MPGTKRGWRPYKRSHAGARLRRGDMYFPKVVSVIMDSVWERLSQARR